MILRIALPIPIDSLFDYRCPTASESAARVGSRVQVPFGQRKMIGLIVEITDTSEVPDNKLKPATQLLDTEPLFDDELLSLGHWAAHYYQHPIGDALFQLIPLLARKQVEPSTPVETYWIASPDASPEQLPNNAVKQRQLLTLLINQQAPVSWPTMRDAGFQKTQLNALLDKGLVQACAPATPAMKTDQPAAVQKHTNVTPNPDQQAAIDAINRSGQFCTFLLAGVTGSGKTEVYFQTIARQLEQGKQALIIVPEIGLTPQLVARFHDRFQAEIVCLHSGLSDRTRYQAWCAAKSGQAQIIIGTRSSIFVPLKNPGILLIDEEHDSSLKQQDGFRYHARDLAVLRASRLNIPLVLGSATPSLESLKNAKEGKYQLLTLNQRAGNARPPTLKLVETRRDALDNGLCDESIEAIRTHLRAGHQALVFINRRGFSPSLVCSQCGSPVDCTRCDAHMTLHRNPPRLHCHHCDRQTPIPKVCHQCGSSDLRPLGQGTERLESRLETLFPGTRIYRVDRDTTYSKTAFDTLMNEVNRGEPCILVGTQMLAKGHHFPAVTLVCIVNADTGLFSADFRGTERMAQLTLQVAGRAGRAEQPGTVLLQTMNAGHPILQTLTEQGYLEFAEEELTTRRLSQLPPYTYQVVIQAEAKTQGLAEQFLHKLRHWLQPFIRDGLSLSGPFPTHMEKRAGFFRAQIILTAAHRGRLQQATTALRGWIANDKESSRVRCLIDVDPTDTL